MCGMQDINVLYPLVQIKWRGMCPWLLLPQVTPQHTPFIHSFVNSQEKKNFRILNYFTLLSCIDCHNKISSVFGTKILAYLANILHGSIARFLNDSIARFLNDLAKEI